MKTVAILSLLVSTIAFANPTGTAGHATTPAATATEAATKAADHGKMVHGKAKAAAASVTTTECKNKAADGKCMDEVKK
jgi:hypothetical protein